MTTFAGFPDRMSLLPVPAALLGTLLRDIDSLAELKLTLYCWRLLFQQKGRVRFVRRSQLQADRALLQTLASGSSIEPSQELASALEAACKRGTLLELVVQTSTGQDACYFLNTGANRDIVEQVQAGELSLGPLEPVSAAAPPRQQSRSSIYELYEQNIGVLTPLIAEELREAELKYPPAWIEDVFREAVAYNRRSWRYISRILDNWETQGRGERGKNRGYPQPPEDPAKYLQGRYGRLIKR